MSRLTGIVAVVALIAGVAADADAHYTVIGGKLVYHSLSCEELLKGVKNPDTNPSASKCTVTGTLVETLCQNPANHDVRPGQAATQVTFFGFEPLSSDDFDKTKGTGSVSVLVTDDPLLGLTDDACVNPNWHLIKALVREADVRFDNYTCGRDDVCGSADDVLASISAFRCTLPAWVDFDTVPPAEGIDFDCSVVSTTHVK